MVKNEKRRTCASLGYFVKDEHKKMAPKPRVGFVSFPVLISSANPSFWRGYGINATTQNKIKKGINYALMDGENLIENGGIVIKQNDRFYAYSLIDIENETLKAIENMGVKIAITLALMGLVKQCTMKFNKALHENANKITNKKVRRAVHEYYLPIIFLNKYGTGVLGIITDMNFLMLPVWKKYINYIEEEYEFAISKINHIYSSYGLIKGNVEIHPGFTDIIRRNIHKKKGKKSINHCEICGNKKPGTFSLHHIVPISLMYLLDFKLEERMKDVENQISLCNRSHNHEGGIEMIISVNEMFTHVKIDENLEYDKWLVPFRLFYLDYAILISRFMLLMRLSLRNEINLLRDIWKDEIEELMKLGKYMAYKYSPNGTIYLSRRNAIEVHSIKICEGW